MINLYYFDIFIFWFKTYISRSCIGKSDNIGNLREDLKKVKKGSAVKPKKPPPDASLALVP